MTIRAITGWLFTLVAAVAACALVTGGREGLTPIDRALPLIALLLVFASFLAVRFGEIAITSIAVLTILAVAVPEERARLLLYGIIVAGALMVALCGMVDLVSRRIEFWRAVGFILICGALLKAIPLAPSELPTLAIFFAGLALLTFLCADSLEGGSLLPLSDTDRKAAASRRTPKVSLHVIPVVLAVGLITPLEPSRAALFPLVLACALGFVRSSSLLFLAAAAILAIPAGRWALLLVALCAAAPLVSRFWRSGSPLVALPAAKRTWAFLLRMLLFSPASMADAFTAPRPLAVSASVLIIVALLVRPAVALMYLIAAVVLVLPLHPSPVRLRLAIPSAIFASVWLTLFAWSGALAPSFPVLSTGASGPISQVIGRALAAGESVVIQPGAGQSHVFLVTSGSNVASLHPDVAVARLEFADQRGEGFARDVRMEEIADWGAFRAGHFFGTQNSLPAQAAMLVDGYGADAFVAGFSRLELKLDQPITSIRVTALPGLPPGATVELHRLELPN